MASTENPNAPYPHLCFKTNSKVSEGPATFRNFQYGLENTIHIYIMPRSLLQSCCMILSFQLSTAPYHYSFSLKRYHHQSDSCNNLVTARHPKRFRNYQHSQAYEQGMFVYIHRKLMLQTFSSSTNKIKKFSPFFVLFCCTGPNSTTKKQPDFPHVFHIKVAPQTCSKSPMVHRESSLHHWQGAQI